MKQFFSILCCLLAFNSVCFGQTELAPRAFIEKLLKDELMPPNIRNSKTSIISSDEVSQKLAIKSKNQGAFNRATIRQVTPSSYNIFLFFQNEDMNEDEHPNWDKKALQVDQFVAKYWPKIGMKRINSIQSAIADARLSRGLILFTYEASTQGITVFTVSIELRLSDGAIGELSTLDNRALLAQVQVSEKISDVSAISLAKKVLPPDFTIDKVANSSRRIARDLRDLERSIHIESDFVMEGLSPTQEKVRIFASFNERTKEMALSGVQPQEVLKSAKSFTGVSDEAVYVAPSDLVLFTTTRDVEGRPWWQRVSNAYSVGYYDLKEKQLKILRPIQPMDADYTEYRVLSASAAGDWLVLNIDAKLAFLNLKSGALHYPERDKAWKQYIALLAEGSEANWRATRSPPWRVSGAAWWGQTDNVVFSLNTGADNNDIYLAKWSADGEQRDELSLFPLQVEEADTELPCVDAVNGKVGYVSKTRDAEALNYHWTFEVIDVKQGDLQTEMDVQTAPVGVAVSAVSLAAKNNVKAKYSVVLDEEPLDTSWDATSQRWLISTHNGLIQVKQKGAQLELKRLSPLTFEGTTIISLDTGNASADGTIILSANLPKSIVSEKTEAVIVRSLFRWDGKSTAVTKFFDQTQNGITRFQFPQKSTSWATVSGH